MFVSFQPEKRLKRAKKNPYASRKKAVGINLSTEVIDYFKGLSKESGIPYQTLIDLYLRDCVKSKKKPKFEWAA
ncbi:MAG: BrnA antitoxin family protein [Nitrospirae bacterium]|nr:BrnA antitoxin family protein [Nitrospirota bacterium]